jgi:hypothetical protein
MSLATKGGEPENHTVSHPVGRLPVVWMIAGEAQRDLLNLSHRTNFTYLFLRDSSA